MGAVAVAAEPFTVAHFKAWTDQLELDSGEKWELEPFQEAFIEDVFAGSRECWLVVPEGNGKTTLLAGLALYHIAHKEEGYVAVAASARDQAEWIWRQADGFVRRSSLDGDFVCLEGYRRIRYDGNSSRIQVFAADDRTGDGAIASLYILDELHRHRSLDLYRLWNGKLNKRPGAQLIIISTAGDPGGEFEEARERMRQTATETDREETFIRAKGPGSVLHEWALPEDGDVEDIAAVKRANPFSGVTVEELERKFASPTFKMPHWRRFVCNLPTRAENAAIQEKEWFDAQTDEQIPEGEPVWVGLDVAWKWDTTAAVPLWIAGSERRVLGAASVLVPPRDGSSLDPNLVEKALIDIHQRNPIHTLVMDTSRAEQLAEWADQEFGCTVVDRPQTNKFAVEDYDRFMEALREGWLKHQGDEDMTRHALNAIARVLPYGDARFDRPNLSRKDSIEQNVRVIDALTAAAMVHSFAASQTTGDPLYDWRELDDEPDDESEVA